MITALFIFDAKGDILISKLYKEGVKRNISDVFRIQVITTNSKNNSAGDSDGRDVRSPVLTLGSTSFIYIKSGLLWICAVTRSNQDCSLVLEFLYNFENLLKNMLIGYGNDSQLSIKKQLTDELITNNFNLIYELLDEVIEFGYPTNLEINYLKNMITSIPASDNIFKIANTRLSRSNNSSNDKPVSNKSSKLSGSNVTWRNTGIKYRRNEIFLNVEERINVLMNAQSEALRVYVDGAIQMKTHLSGMPECRFGLSDDSMLLNLKSSENQDSAAYAYTSNNRNNNEVTLEDSKFHQCVDLTKFDLERVIQFIPPDGDFQLMSYHCLLNINLPFKVYPQVQEIGRLKLHYKIRVKSAFPARLPATNVQIKIPTPRGVIKSMATNSLGKSKFHPEENLFIWKFNKFFGEQEHIFTGEVELSNNHNDFGPNSSMLEDDFNQVYNNGIINWNRPPIKLEFKLDMFSCSGLTVKFLKVQEKLNYRTVKWVKYCTQAGSYDIRY